MRIRDLQSPQRRHDLLVLAHLLREAGQALVDCVLAYEKGQVSEAGACLREAKRLFKKVGAKRKEAEL